MMKEMLSTHLFELQDSHSMFWWVTANANRTFVCLQEKLLGASFDAVRWKMFFWSFPTEKLQNFLHPWLFLMWYSDPRFCQFAVFQNRTGCYFFETPSFAKTSQWPWICGIIMSVQVFPPVQSERVLWSLKRTITTLSLCRFTVVPPPLWAVTRGNVIFFTAVHSVTQDFIYFFFFSCDPNLRQFFFPSCRSALSSSGSATYYLQPETQLRQKVSQTERERESLTERIRGENCRSWMNEGLKMTQKNCFPCSPWVILSEQLSAFSSRWLSHRNNKPCVRRLS